MNFRSVVVRGKIGLDVWKNRFLPEVEFDHLGNVIVGDLVVCDASADRIREVYVSLAVRFDDARNTEDGILAKDRGIDEIIVDSAVNNVNLPKSLGGLHENS